MSATAEGQKIVNKTQEYKEGLQEGLYTGLDSGNIGTGASNRVEFPREFSAGSPQDDMLRYKAKVVAQSGNNLPVGDFGVVTQSDRDLQALLRKQKALEAADFDRWIGSNYAKNDPALQQWLQETFPDYYQLREKKLIDRAKFVTRVKLMQLRGPRDEEDLMIKYGLESGRIALPKDWDRIGVNYTSKPDDATIKTKQNQRMLDRLWNWRTILTGKELSTARTQNADFADQPTNFIGQANDDYTNAFWSKTVDNILGGSN